MTESSSEKDNNKNNLLLAMLWLQRHREIMSLSQQNTDSTTASKVRFLYNEYIWGFRHCSVFFWIFLRVELICFLLFEQVDKFGSDWAFFWILPIITIVSPVSFEIDSKPFLFVWEYSGLHKFFYHVLVHEYQGRPKNLKLKMIQTLQIFRFQ